jgi:hypothetical protein
MGKADGLVDWLPSDPSCNFRVFASFVPIK